MELSTILREDSFTALILTSTLSFVLVLGESGSYLYVTAEGEFEVVKGGGSLGRLGVGKVFGELAILYNCKR